MLTSQVALPSSSLARPGIGSNREVSEHAGINDQGQISKLMLSRLEGQGLVENTQAVNPQCFGPSGLKTGGKTLTHPRPSGAQHNTNRGAYVPSVLQEER
jgi:hypothetical protein